MIDKNKNIKILDIGTKILDILENNNIFTLNDLCCIRKSELKKMELTQKEIEKIQIELQLTGLNLKNNL